MSASVKHEAGVSKASYATDDSHTAIECSKFTYKAFSVSTKCRKAK